MLAKHLPPLPPRLASLPIDPRGYPVPWFVTWLDAQGNPCRPGEGEPDFRRVAVQKIATAVSLNVCWICGGRLGSARSFVLGPLAVINRISSEPPSHRDCAEFAARACPFLVRPKMRRVSDVGETPGLLNPRNPGVAIVWTTRWYQTFRASHGGEGLLFDVGDPMDLQWYAEGREATRQEVLDSIDGGYPELQRLAALDGPRATEDLERRMRTAINLLPVV